MAEPAGQDVPHHREPLDQVELLEDEADPGLERGAARGSEAPVTVVPSTTMLPPVGAEQAVEAAQQGRLAGAAAADDADELTGWDLEREVLERFVAVGEDHPEVANRDHRHPLG